MSRNHTLPFVLALLVLQLAACSRAIFLDDDAADASTGVQLNGGSGGAPGSGAVAGSPAADPPAVDASASTPADDTLAIDAAVASPPQLPPSTFTGNPPGCPSTTPENGSACAEESSGDVCAYDYADPRFATQSLYNECQCRVGCDGTLAPRWDCYENVVSSRMSCPPERPEDGSSCFGFKGYECRYPTLVTCKCSDNPGEDDWSCETTSNARDLEPFPAIADDTVLVRDIGDDEAQALCGWLTFRGAGFPEPPELVPDANGLYPSSGCRGSHYFDCHIFWPDEVPAAACVDNLAVSTCEATLSELRDCMLTMLSSVQVGIGCGPYFAKAGCPGTIAIESASGNAVMGDLCRWRVR